MVALYPGLPRTRENKRGKFSRVRGRPGYKANAMAGESINTLTLVLSVCVCVCVTDVTSTNKPRLRENTREDRDVIICVHS